MRILPESIVVFDGEQKLRERPCAVGFVLGRERVAQISTIVVEFALALAWHGRQYCPATS